MKNIAVMQPYIFPYIGYIQLVKSVDDFVFYDDVNFIKRGWINRNKILINNNEKLISFPCIKASQNKLIKDVEIDINDKMYSNILSTIEQAYSKAPYFKDVYPLIKTVFESKSGNIGELASLSITEVSKYLGLNTNFHFSSILSPETKEYDKADRLIAITKKLKSSNYLNAIGGQKIYNKDYFKNEDVNLLFLEPKIKPYDQFDTNFVGGLSIIDIMMFNDIEEANKLINDFKLL